MGPERKANPGSLIIGGVTIIMGVASGISLHHLISLLNGWQALGYVLVSGIFIGLVAAILNEVLSFFYDE